MIEAGSLALDLSGTRLGEGSTKLLVVASNRVLREFLDDIVRRPEENSGVGLAEHGGVVVGIPCCHSPEIEVTQGGHGPSLSVVDPQLVARDPIVYSDFQAMTEEARMTELAHQWRRKLVEGVR